MYEIKPENVKTFITNRNIRLPRFQRKLTWKEKDNFQLCISVFKGYPIGVCILSSETSRNGNIRWLLDGRQRKYALTMMYEDPENIYNWARKFIKFKNSDQPNELKDKFWLKIKEYLEEDMSQEEEEEYLDEYNDCETAEIEILNEIEEEYNTDKDGLELLLEIILIIHNKKSNGTGFSIPFDFGNAIERIPYFENGTNYLSSKKLKTFIDQYRQFCYENNLTELESTSFYDYLDTRVIIKDPDKLKRLLKERWQAILERINILNKIDNLLIRCEIGVIEVKDLNASDSQKIFEIINSGGEKLTAVEILSAKPSWNTPIVNISGSTTQTVNELYQDLGITRPDNVVKWDLPATLLRRVDMSMILKNTDFEKELTIGFQLMAGIYEKSITKDSIEQLSRNKRIKWDIDYENLISDLSQMLRLISTSDYFKFLKSWQTSIQELTCLGCALNFILVSYELWSNNGKPIGSDSAAKKFLKNVFILWDKMIYEYVHRQWSGSMDSKISKNIEKVKNNDETIFNPISTDKWLQLLDDIINKSKIGEADIKYDLMKPILYHYYCLNCIAGPDTIYSIEVDHIIPQTKFEESCIVNNKIVKDNLFNLGLLPKNENISKGNKILRHIESDWLKQEIEKYEQIPVEKFDYFSNINHYKELFEFRKPFFDRAYDIKRSYLLNN